MFNSDIGIDLGTTSILVYVKNKGIIINEPSVVAIDTYDNQVIAIGEEASQMIGKTPDNITVIRPLRQGVVSNYNATETMLKHFLKKAIGNSSRKPRVSVCVPSEVTAVERKAVQDAVKDTGAREVYVIEEPIAAAIGAEIDITRACGNMIIDIGGGTCDIAVISLGGEVVKSSIKVAGDDFDEMIVRYIRKKHNVLIGEKSAEKLKINIGTAHKLSAQLSMDIGGKNLVTGLPITITITSEEIYEALEEAVVMIEEAVQQVLEQTPPELASDVYERGIVMTGGGSLLHGLDKAIKERTQINAVLATDAISCVAIGTGKHIEYNYKFRKSEYIKNNRTIGFINKIFKMFNLKGLKNSNKSKYKDNTNIENNSTSTNENANSEKNDN
ncbi:MAG: rod shape-determining protein MreB [bacterium]